MIQMLNITGTDLDRLFEDNRVSCIYMHEVRAEEHWVGYHHCHPNCEICYIFSGTGTITLGVETHRVGAGDLLFVPKGVYHFEQASDDNPFHIIFLIVEHTGPKAEFLNDLFSEVGGYLPMQNPDRICQLFRMISQEIVEQEPGFLTIVNGALRELYIRRIRSAQVDAFKFTIINMSDTARKHKELFRKVDRYIYMNLNLMQVSVKNIAENFHYHPKYLSQMYKRETGETLSDHINSMRLERAKEYLENSEISFPVIVEQLGFSNMNSFYRMFKRNVGVTPGAYREQLRRLQARAPKQSGEDDSDEPLHGSNGTVETAGDEKDPS